MSGGPLRFSVAVFLWQAFAKYVLQIAALDRKFYVLRLSQNGQLPASPQNGVSSQHTHPLISPFARTLTQYEFHFKWMM